MDVIFLGKALASPEPVRFVDCGVVVTSYAQRTRRGLRPQHAGARVVPDAVHGARVPTEPPPLILSPLVRGTLKERVPEISSGVMSRLHGKGSPRQPAPSKTEVASN